MRVLIVPCLNRIPDKRGLNPLFDHGLFFNFGVVKPFITVMIRPYHGPGVTCFLLSSRFVSEPVSRKR
jgi:hypothetical protein